ncbi:MAG: hypothetical protein H6869_00420 [Rhodospirillales bacterium]|nr:hypothetical protein [Rhodospirillales bacterium]
MLTVLISIIVAGRVKTLRTALIVALLLPFSVLFMGASPANLVLTIPANLLAAFFAFKHYEKRRKEKEAGVVKEDTPFVKWTKLAFGMIILGAILYLGHLLLSMGILENLCKSSGYVGHFA